VRRPGDPPLQARVHRRSEPVPIGRGERACAHRVTVAESRPRDLDNLARVARCTKRLGVAFLGEDLVAERTPEERKKVASLTPSDDVRGDVQLTATWDSPVRAAAGARPGDAA